MGAAAASSTEGPNAPNGGPANRVVSSSGPHPESCSTLMTFVPAVGH